MDGFRVLEIKKSVFESNDREADLVREQLKRDRTFLLNLMSSPGSGKTTTHKATIAALKDEFRIGVMEADIDSDVDAATIEKTGAKVIQLHTGGMCHLDAGMTKQGLDGLGDRVRVNIGVYIRFHYADAHFVLQGRNSCLERGGLARAGGRHEVEEECFFLFQLLSELIRFPVVIFKYAFFDLQYSEAFHNSCTSVYFSLVNSLSYSAHCQSFCC